MKVRKWSWLRWLLIGILLFLVVTSLLIFLLAQKEKPEQIVYGASFNTLYARELNLDWKETYDAMLDELGVRHLRLAAHWTMVEERQDEYDFSELDYQVARAEEVGATVVMAVGRRLPRWPECHIPEWAASLPEAERNEQLLSYIETVINRYKDSPAITVWQVENEPFLEVFAFEHCGHLDTDLLDKEIALVRSLDGTRPILVTDSGNLGTWTGAYSRGDMFGTSVYVHFWNPELGQFRTFLPPWFYRVKDNLMSLAHGKKTSVLIELSAEPWLIEPITEVDLDVQFTRMNPEKFEDILQYAEKTYYGEQYLWGAEWWYWLHLQGRSDMWDRAKELYKK